MKKRKIFTHTLCWKEKGDRNPGESPKSRYSGVFPEQGSRKGVIFAENRGESAGISCFFTKRKSFDKGLTKGGISSILSNG